MGRPPAPCLRTLPVVPFELQLVKLTVRIGKRKSLCRKAIIRFPSKAFRNAINRYIVS